MVFLRTHQPYSGTGVLMETKLERIAEISASSPRPEFTSLYHLINKEMLMQCHKELDGSKAVGMDEITKREYEKNLEQNIDACNNDRREILCSAVLGGRTGSSDRAQ